MARDFLSQLQPQTLGPHGRKLYSTLQTRLIDEFGLSIDSSPNEAAAAPVEDDKFYLSERTQAAPKEGISIVSCCMNRNANLAHAVKSWLRTTADEIVIVDWSSTTPVSESLAELSDPRLKIIRVVDEIYWVLTSAFNVGLGFASYSRVFKLDADIEVTPDFMQRNSFRSGQFIRGSWEHARDAGKEDQIFVNGSFGAFKTDLVNVGFYNEYIRSYGWDDSDLYERLTLFAGLEGKLLDFETINHREQHESTRTAHQQLRNSLFLEQVMPTDFNITANRYLTRILGWWDGNLLQDFSVERVGPRRWKAKRRGMTPAVPGHCYHDSRIYAALELLGAHRSDLLSADIDPKLLAQFMYEEFEAGYPLSETELLLGKKDDACEVVFPHPSVDLMDFLGRLIHEGEQVIVVVPGQRHERCAFSLRDGKGPIVRTEPVEQYRLLRRIGETISPDSGQSEEESSQDLSAQSASLVGLANGQSGHLSRFSCKTKRIFIDCQHGLGNRLRAIASAAAIAESTGRELVVIWQPDEHCDCAFSDLFDYDGLVLDRSFHERLDTLSTDFYTYIEVEPDAEKSAPIAIRGNDIYVRSAYVLNSPHDSFARQNAFLRRLTPTQAVRKLMNGINVSASVGVHIRSEGAVGSAVKSYDSQRHYTKEGFDEIQYWRSRCHFSNFVPEIHRLLKEEHHKAVFLASDESETYKEMRREFGDRLQCLERRHFDRSKSQLQYALADILLLSDCRSFLGSHWSSFSEMAVRFSEGYEKVAHAGVDF